MPKLLTAYRMRQKRRFKSMQQSQSSKPSSSPQELGANTPEDTAAMLEQSTIQPPDTSELSGQEPENAPPATKRPPIINKTTGKPVKPQITAKGTPKKPPPRTTTLNKGKGKLTAKGKR